MAGKPSQTTFTFQITFVSPKGMNIPTARALIKAALIGRKELCIEEEDEVKVHLTNKEVKYG